MHSHQSNLEQANCVTLRSINKPNHLIIADTHHTATWAKRKINPERPVEVERRTEENGGWRGTRTPRQTQRGGGGKQASYGFAWLAVLFNLKLGSHKRCSGNETASLSLSQTLSSRNQSLACFEMIDRYAIPFGKP